MIYSRKSTGSPNASPMGAGSQSLLSRFRTAQLFKAPSRWIAGQRAAGVLWTATAGSSSLKNPSRQECPS